ncbi:competence protein CoiA family protein, partial [Ralstonia sp. 121560039-2]
MPLKCLDADESVVFAHQLTRDEFEALRASQKVRQSLHFACCSARVGLRVSKNGLNHFYHLSGGGSCPYEEETEAHLSLKIAVMEAARRADWQADCEVSGGCDESQQWRADVLATKGAVKVAIEVQISNATWAQVVARQARYHAAGVRGLWLLGQDNYQVCKEVPAFQVRDDGDGEWMVRISPPKEPHNVCMRAFKGNWLALDSFIQAALTKNLVWAPVLEMNRVDVIVRASPHPHCACGARLLLPTSLAVSLPCPGYRSLLWTVTPSPHQLKANPGPVWLNALARLINRKHPVNPSCQLGGAGRPAMREQFGDVGRLVGR